MHGNILNLIYAYVVHKLCIWIYVVWSVYQDLIHFQVSSCCRLQAVSLLLKIPYGKWAWLHAWHTSGKWRSYLRLAASHITLARRCCFLRSSFRVSMWIFEQKRDCLQSTVVVLFRVNCLNKFDTFLLSTIPFTANKHSVTSPYDIMCDVGKPNVGFRIKRPKYGPWISYILGVKTLKLSQCLSPPKAQLYKEYIYCIERHGGLMVGALNSRPSGLGSIPGRGTLCCVLGQDTF